MSDRITWMHSGQVGAPQMGGVEGSNGQMLQVLDACLINGFNTQTATTVSKTETTVKLTFGVSHGYVERQLLLIAGATDAKLNGKHRVIAVTENTVTIDAVGVGSITGTITSKIAPLGFESIFGSTDPLKRAYRSKNVQTTRTVLYLDMSLPTSHGYNSTNPAKRAMVDMCENMTTLGVQINSYTSSFNDKPTVQNGKMFWYQARNNTKNGAVNAGTNLKWVLFGNGDYFYFLPAWQVHDLSATRLLQRDLFGFGDVKDLDGTSSYDCFWAGVSGTNDEQSISYAANGGRINGIPTSFNYSTDRAYSAGFYIKSSSGVGGLQQFSLVTSGVISTSHSSNSGSAYSVQWIYTAFPNKSGSSLLSTPLYSMIKDTDYRLRSEMGRLRAIPQNLNNQQSLDLNVIEDVVLIAVSANGIYNFNTGFLAVDTRD